MWSTNVPWCYCRQEPKIVAGLSCMNTFVPVCISGTEKSGSTVLYSVAKKDRWYCMQRFKPMSTGLKAECKRLKKQCLNEMSQFILHIKCLVSVSLFTMATFDKINCPWLQFQQIALDVNGDSKCPIRLSDIQLHCSNIFFLTF